MDFILTTKQKYILDYLDTHHGPVKLSKTTEGFQLLVGKFPYQISWIRDDNKLDELLEFIAKTVRIPTKHRVIRFNR